MGSVGEIRGAKVLNTRTNRVYSVNSRKGEGLPMKTKPQIELPLNVHGKPMTRKTKLPSKARMEHRRAQSNPKLRRFLDTYFSDYTIKEG